MNTVARVLNLLGPAGHSLTMRTSVRWTVILMGSSLGLGWNSGASAADFELTPIEAQRVEKQEIVIRAALDPGQRRGTVRAAMLIDAPTDVVFQTMTRCADALQYVPHLRVCRVRDRAADLSWELVEHEIDFGWYAPRIQYVFRADFVADRSIAFHQVSGDFKANQGV